MITRVLVPLDGSKLAEHAFEEAVPLAQGLGATLVLLRVVPPPEDARLRLPGTSDKAREVNARAAEEYLLTTAARIAARRLSTETHVRSGPVVETVIEEARRQHCDLIALTSHGMGGLGRHVFGSVARELLNSRSCPVLVFPSSAEHLEEQEEEEEKYADQALVREITSGPPHANANPEPGRA